MLKKFSITLPLLASLLAMPAVADVKYKHNVEGPKVDPNNDKLKPVVPKPLEAPKASSDITADKLLQVDIEISGDLDALIEEYKGALEDMKGTNDPRILDIGFRLAETYAQKQRIEHSQAMEAALAIDKATTDADKKKFHDVATKHLAAEKQWLTLAIGAYNAVAQSPDLTKFKQADQVLFYYAFTLQTAGYGDQARDVYKLLLKNFQGSPFVPDAYNAFADNYYEQGDLANAEAFYTKVLQFQSSPLYPYALYKRAWVYYNEKRFDDSMKGMVETIHRTDGDAKNDQMNKQAKKDFVRVYSDNPNAPVDTAYVRFQGLDKTQFSFKLYVMLADFYFAEGKSQQAVWVYHDLMRKSPQDPLLCDWQYKIVQLSFGAPKKQIADEISNMVKLYTFLKKNNILKAADLQDCHDNAAQMAGDTAKLWHLEGLKTLNQETLDYAHQLYQVYLENFTDADNAPELQYDYAELLWKAAEMEKDQKRQTQRFQEAAIEYTKCTDMPQVAPEQKKNCALVALLAWKNALAVDPGADNPTVDATLKEGDIPKPDVLPDGEQKFMAAMDKYLATITDTKDDERTEILFSKCRIYWRHNHFDEAIPLCEQVLNERPDHQYAEFAMNILLDSFNKSQRLDDLVEWDHKLLDNTKFMTAHPDAKDVLAPIKETADRKSAELKEKKGLNKECGDAYVALIKDYPDSADIDQLLYNAAVCFEKAKRLGFAVLYRKKLIQQFPKSPLAERAQYALGLNYMAIASYDAAADQFETYAHQFGGEKDAEPALNNAVFFRKGLGEDDKAQTDTDFYISQYRSKDIKKAADAAFSLVAIDEKKKDWDGVVTRMTDYLNRWGGQGGVDKDIIAHVKIGEALWLHQSCPVQTELGACIQTAAHAHALKTAKAKVSTTQQQCGDPSKSKITVYDRRPQPTQDAMTHFKRAIALFNGGAAIAAVPGKDDKEKAAKVSDMIYWVQAANFYLGDSKFEDVLRMQFPHGLTFPSDNKKKFDADTAKFKDFITQKSKAVGDARAYYATIIQQTTDHTHPEYLAGALWAIASAARIGMAWQDFSDQIWTMDIPKELQADQDMVDSYCDELQKQADPLADKSVEGYSFCLNTSTQLNWFNDWSKLCEAQLSQVKPQDYPEAGEIHAEPVGVPLTIDFQSIAGIEGVDVDATPTSQPAAAPTPAAPAAPKPAAPTQTPNHAGHN